MKDGPNDAHLWAMLAAEFRAAGVTASTDACRHARRAVALVRRERDPHARTFAPGDEIPYDVSEVTDLDGDKWVRLADPPDTGKDTWRMPGYDPADCDPAAGGCYLTPHLLDQYGPLTEITTRRTP